MNWRWLLLIPIVWGCDDYNDCGITDFSEELYVAFYDSVNNNLAVAERKKTLKDPELDSIRLTYADGTRVVLVIETDEESEPLTGISLPLDVSDTITTYHFITETEKYLLQVWYRREAILENPECGPVFRLKGAQATDPEDTDLDSVAIQVLELTTQISPHVEIYF